MVAIGDDAVGLNWDLNCDYVWSCFVLDGGMHLQSVTSYCIYIPFILVVAALLQAHQRSGLFL